MTDIDERLDRLEQANIAKLGRPSMVTTFNALPAPPAMGEFARAKYDHDQKVLRERYAQEEAQREREQREHDRVAAEAEAQAEARRIANAPAVAEIDTQLEELRGLVQPLEHKTDVLVRKIRRLEAERDALL